MINISFHPSAIIDVNLSQNWYGQESKMAADKFSLSIMKSIKNLEKFPLSFPTYFANIRRAVVHGFPYNIYYQLENYKIIILAVAHTHRDPLYLTDTLKLRNTN